MKITNLKANTKNVLPNTQVKITCNAFNNDRQIVEAKLKLMLIGTNVKKEVINIPLDEKDLSFTEEQSRTVEWALNYPNEKRRFNFLGYLQWSLNNNSGTGIISSFLFTAGLEYDISIDDITPVIEDDQIRAFDISLANNEIEKLFCSLKLIIKKDSEEIILENSEWINYKLNSRIEIPSEIKTDFEYNLQVFINNNLAIESGWQSYSRKIKERIPFKITYTMPERPTGKQNIPYDYLMPAEKLINRVNYGGIQLLRFNNDELLLSYNLTPVFSSQWEQILKEDPLVWDRFKDDLFSYIYLKDPELATNLKSEIKVWQDNVVWVKYLVQFVSKKFKGKKKKEYDEKLERIYRIINTIVNNLSIIIKNNFVTQKLYHSLCLYKKQYYLDFLSLKKETLGISQEETVKVKEYINLINDEKGRIKNKIGNILSIARSIIKQRDKFYDYYNNLSLEGMPETIVSEKEPFELKFNLVNRSSKNNLYMQVKISHPHFIKLINKPAEFKYPVYNSKISNINTITLKFDFIKNKSVSGNKIINIDFSIAKQQ